MIDRNVLSADLRKLVRDLEEDLAERCAEVPEVDAALRASHAKAKEARRTAEGYEEWRHAAATQTAAAWVLSCVFARFLEDNRLLDPPRIAGPAAAPSRDTGTARDATAPKGTASGSRLQRALDEHEMYVQRHPRDTDREFLLWVFAEIGKLPGGADIFGKHNPIHEHPGWLSGDGARLLRVFFQKVSPETGYLVHDFTDPGWDTRFLGDLYQELSEEAKKRYALLQTPEFVEEFILERTLEPAVEEFGLEGFRMIDPACGSGHFLLGAFRRLLDRWHRVAPGLKPMDAVLRALSSVHGVDVNPYAVAIARFRLLVEALRACEVTELARAPAFRIQLACGDSLLHGREGGEETVLPWHGAAHAYFTEDLEELRKILRSGQYHAVVANPPYITPKDAALNKEYRERYESCHKKYSLAVPFMERIFSLAVPGGYTGQITANSFMKREFGKKLVEQVLPNLDLTHVIDTSGAYIPGHGTPTVILFGRNRNRVGSNSTIRAVLGIRGEPETPEDPARGKVWTSITSLIDTPGTQDEFVSVSDMAREKFAKHPWSIGGGGAAELKERLDAACLRRLGDLAEAIGITAVTGEDDLFVQSPSMINRLGIEDSRPLVVGDLVRDWIAAEPEHGIWLYDDDFRLRSLDSLPATARLFWRFRSNISRRKRFGVPMLDRGLTWYEWQELYSDKLRTPLSIVYAEIASHNHFVLDRGGKVFKQTAPVIKLPKEASEEEHLALLGLLNSSTGCFWMKQVAHQKQMTGGDGVRVESKSKVPYAFAGTQLAQFPIPAGFQDKQLRGRLLEHVRAMEDVIHRQQALSAGFVLQESIAGGQNARQAWTKAQSSRKRMRAEVICLQEQIDFVVYAMFGLCRAEFLDGVTKLPTDLEAGQRPFEILRHENPEGFPVPAIMPKEWPPDFCESWSRRLNAIKESPDLTLIEEPHYKRRWIGRQGVFNLAVDKDELASACEAWLLDRLESYFDSDGRLNDEGKPTAKVDRALVSTARLTDLARQDEKFLEAAEVYRGRADFDVARLVEELVEAESVPLLPVLRYTPSGLEKRKSWERTWDLQRQEDEIDARTKLPKGSRDHLTEVEARDLKKKTVGDIPVPPKYVTGDFQKQSYWRLRGKLDVPKERWVSFPHCEGADRTPVVAWAGLNHLELARAISAYYVEIQEKIGGRDDPRLVPLLACLLELLPWLKQWHNEVDPGFGMRMGDYFEGFVQDEARHLGKSLLEVREWQPPSRGQASGGRKKVSKKQRDGGGTARVAASPRVSGEG